MTLYQYLAKNQINKAEFARDLGIAESSLFKYINQEREPKLAIAIRILKLTKGKVTLKDMLKEDDEWKFKSSRGRPRKAKRKSKPKIDIDLL